MTNILRDCPHCGYSVTLSVNIFETDPEDALDRRAADKCSCPEEADSA